MRFPQKDNDPQQVQQFEYSVEKIKEVTKLLKRASSNTQSQLHYLRVAFSYSQDFVDAFLDNENSLYTLVGYLTGNESILQLEAAWCITNMSANDHKKMLNVVKATGPYLITYLQSGSELLANQSAWALGNMAADDVECRKLLKEQGIVKPLLDLANKVCIFKLYFIFQLHFAISPHKFIFLHTLCFRISKISKPVCTDFCYFLRMVIF